VVTTNATAIDKEQATFLASYLDGLAGSDVITDHRYVFYLTAAAEFLRVVEQNVEIPINIVGVGPARDAYLHWTQP
jgi:adenylosuccinate synthase